MAEAEEPPDTTTPPHSTSTPALSASTEWPALAETPVAFVAAGGAVMEGGRGSGLRRRLVDYQTFRLV